MKIILFIMLCVPIIAFSQNRYGIDIGFTTKKCVFANLKYFQNKHGFILGATYQLNKSIGNAVSERLPNYGLTPNGSGNYFCTVNFGYIKTLTDRISLSGEFSIGIKKDYTNYRDARFTNDGYHLVYNERTIFGIGLSGVYNFTENYVGLISYNTISGAGIGLGFTF